MKRMGKIVVLFLLAFTLAGCGNDSGRQAGQQNGNSVDEVLDSRIGNYESETGGNDTQSAITNNGIDTGSSEKSLEETATGTDDGVDYDLSAMSSGMAYATVNQIWEMPDSYIGKSIRMEGIYDIAYSGSTSQFYHYCLIQDFSSCCAQGLEFVWGDGSHAFPDEYPEVNTEIVVEGVFETYQEEGNDALFCRLKDAVLTVKP